MSEAQTRRRTSGLSGGLRRLKEAELAWIVVAQDALRDVDVNDRTAFVEIIAETLPRLSSAEAVADGLGVAPTTVGRWISGANTPPPYARAPVVQYLHDLASLRAMDLRHALGISEPPAPKEPKALKRAPAEIVPIGGRSRRRAGG